MKKHKLSSKIKKDRSVYLSTKNTLNCILNTHPFHIKQLLSKKGLELVQVTDEMNIEEYNDCEDIVLGFVNNLPLLFKHINSLTTPPFVWDSSTLIYYLHFYFKIKILDGVMYHDGTIHFKKPSAIYLKINSRSKFNTPPYYKLSTDSDGFPKLQNKFDYVLRSFLKTIPLPVYEPFLIALTSAFKINDYSIVDNFISHNRLYTGNYNRTQFIKLSEFLFSFKKHIIELVNKGSDYIDNFTEDRTKSALYQILFLIDNFSKKSLKVFLDEERTITPKSFTLVSGI